jgi:AraC family transcriptional regulator
MSFAPSAIPEKPLSSLNGRQGLYFTPDRGVSSPRISASHSKVYKPIESTLGGRVGLSSAAAGWSEDVLAECWSLPPTEGMQSQMQRHRLIITVGPAPTYVTWDDDGRKGAAWCASGAISLKPQNSTNSVARTSDLNIVSLEFSSALMSRLLDGRDAGAPSEQLVPCRNAFDAIAAGLAQCIMAEMVAPTERLYGELLCLAVAAHVLRAYGRARPDAARGRLSPVQARRVIDYIRAHLDGAISVAALAREVGLSEAHFARAFRAAFDMPPHQLILRWRLQRAARLIRLHGFGLADAAFAAGFCDQSHMTNAVRRHFGTSPAALLSL